MEIVIVNESGIQKPEEYIVEYNRIASKVTQRLNLSEDLCCSLVFVTDDYIHQVNREYRGIDRATDVISFALRDQEDAYQTMDEIENELGDILVSVQAIERQAQEYGHSYKREALFLFTHGLLHLLGYDHMSEEDEKVMFPLQEELLDGEV